MLDLTGAGGGQDLPPDPAAPPPPMDGDPVALPIADDGLPVDPMAPPRPPELDLLEKLAAALNAAALMDDDGETPLISDEQLQKISRQVDDGYVRDKASRHEWEDQAKRSMETAKQRRQGKSYPFPNAANVQYPLITIAAEQFNARAYPAICTGTNVVKVRIGGADPGGVKAARASRIQQHMSHQITDGMAGVWERDMDVMLYQLPILGSAFKKSWWDFDLNSPQSCMISAFDFIVHSDTRHLRNCPRMSQRFPLYPYEIEDRMRSGTFLDVDLAALGNSQDEQSPIWFIEQHCYYDLDGDGYAEPWIVTQTEDGGKLVRITAGFDPLDVVHDGEKIVRIPRDDYFTSFYFLPDPEGSFYGIGFGHLLRSFGEVIDSSFNMMLDAGNLQNAGGGFIGDGLDFQSEAEEFRFEPGKYYTVNNDGQDIRHNIVNMDFKGPSPVLFQLLGMMMESAKQIISVQDILTGAAHAQTMQPTTLMALIDQGMKVFTAIYKRIYDSLGQEFRIIYRLNRKYLDNQDYLDFLGVTPDLAPMGQPLMLPPPGAEPQAGLPPQGIPGPQMAAPPVSGAPPMAGPGPVPGGMPPEASPQNGPMPTGDNGGMPPQPGAPMMAQPGPAPMPQMPMGPPPPPPPSVEGDFADDGCRVVPAADPSSITMAQQMARASFLMQLLHDPVVGRKLDADDILMRILNAGAIDNIPAALAKPSPPTPMDQLPILKAQADIKKTDSEAVHNYALAAAESSRGEHYQAQSANLIAGHQPDFFTNPPV